jgi:SAM-dependent methyltransferase
MPSPTYENRRLSFGSDAARYDAFRPRYPRMALVWALAGASRKVVDVADVGAGTGALTGGLLDLGLRVRAVEPDAGMLGALAENHPDVERFEGPAEKLPFEDGSLDAIAAGQAWHWFDKPASAAEFGRVLRPGGVVALLWNVRDDRVDWMARLSDLIEGEDSMRASRTEAYDEIAAVHPGVVRADIPHRVTMTPDEIVALTSTFSYVRLRDDADDVYAAVAELLATHPQTRGRRLVDVPYVTAAYRWERPGRE